MMARKLSHDEIITFQKTVYSHYNDNKRSYPWRETYDPYKITVSEFMLQQTQTSRVVEKYIAFIEEFPTIHALACASRRDVLELWKGLGYYRRAMNLHETAKRIVSEYDGILPNDASLLKTLPGIGEYTSSAIIAFAFGLPVIVLDTNIRTTFIHHFFDESEKIRDNEIRPLIKQTCDTSDPRNWYYALMDYGAMLKKTIGNASKKSANYKKQSTFEGSFRQKRAKILKLVIDEGTVSVPSISRKLDISESIISEILHKFEKEGVIKKNDDVFEILD